MATSLKSDRKLSVDIFVLRFDAHRLVRTAKLCSVGIAKDDLNLRMFTERFMEQYLCVDSSSQIAAAGRWGRYPSLQGY